MTPTGIRGIGQTSPRTEAIRLFKNDFSIRRISEMLDVSETQVQDWVFGKKPTRASRGRRGISEASPEQRRKVKGRPSIIPGEGPIDPMHLWSRGRGGCDDPLCVVPGARSIHRAFDAGELDILPALIAHRYIEEIAHAVLHADGDLLAVLERLSADKYVPLTTGGPE
jgi:hypothetical protein